MKGYIGKFSEIAHEPVQRQAELFERARYAAFSTLGLSKQAAVYFVLSLLPGFAVALIFILILGFSLLYAGLGAGVGSMIGVFLYFSLYQGLLYKGYSTPCS